MSKSAISLEIDGLQAQLDTLKAVLETKSYQSSRKPKKKVSFAKLHGLWKGKFSLSLEEIQASEIWMK